jgi:prevent-host-death family protein
MSTITAIEAKDRFAELLVRVSQGEEVVITDKNVPVARMVPERRDRSLAVQEAVAGLRELQNRIEARTGGQKISADQFREALEEGRG